MKPGPTGEFPHGKISDRDEGELAVGVAIDRANGIIRIAFGTPIEWFGMPRDKAIEFGERIIKSAKELPETQ